MSTRQPPAPSAEDVAEDASRHSPVGETPRPHRASDFRNRRIFPRVAEIREEATEFEKKYPPDAFGDELSENARIWSIYRDEATEHDKRLIAAWNRSLDILLIFAGLFSAVATAFIIESYQLLQPDWSEYTAKLLFVTIAAQAGSPNMTLPTPTELAAMSPSIFSAPSVSRWINGFWVSSLAVSLAVALLSILAKQWLDQYHARTASPSRGAHDWSRRRALYYDGVKKWHLGTLITMLPALLHASLFLFFLGLILFFWGLDRGISGCLALISSCILGFYVSAGFLTHWHTECPFYIPLFRQLHRLLGAVDRRSSWWRSTLSRTLEAEKYTLDARIICWLVNASPIQEVVSAAITALGAAPRGSDLFPSLSQEGSSVWDGILSATLHFYAHLNSPAVHRPGQEGLRDAIDPDASAAYDYYRTGWTLVRMASFLQESLTAGHGVEVVAANALDAVRLVVYDRPLSLTFHPAADILRMNAHLLRVLHGAANRDDARIALMHFSQQDHLPPAPVHVSHTLHMLAAVEHKFHVPQFLPSALSILHRSMRHYGPSSTLSPTLDFLHALCVSYNVVALPDLRIDPHKVMSNALSLYCHLISHAADYRLCLDASGSRRDAFLHEDLTRIARTIFEVERIHVSENAHVSELLASDWFPSTRWNADVLDVLSSQFDFEHARAADGICNLLMAAVRSNAVLHLFFWITMLPVEATKDCMAIFDPSRGENGVSVWRTLYLHAIHAVIEQTEWDGRAWKAHYVLSFLFRSALRMRICDVAPSGGEVCELFAVDCIAAVLRQLALSTEESTDTKEIPWYPLYKNWPLVARGLISEMCHMLPGAWPELRERLLADDGDAVDHVRISRLVEELEVEVQQSRVEVNTSVLES